MTNHARSNVPGTEEGCEGPHQVDGINYVNDVPRYFTNYALVSKTLNGPGHAGHDLGLRLRRPAHRLLHAVRRHQDRHHHRPAHPHDRQHLRAPSSASTTGCCSRSVESGSSGTLRSTSYGYRAPNAGPYVPVIGDGSGVRTR